MAKSRREKRMPFAGRIKASMLAAGLDTQSVAEKVGVTPQVVRRWLKDKSPHMSAAHLIKLAVVLNVRAHWLAEGEGPVSRTNSAQYSREDMLAAFDALTPEERRMLRDIVGVILRNREG